MDNEIQEIIKKAKQMACKKGFPEEADDFSQVVAIAFWEAKAKAGDGTIFFNLKYKWVDYIRSQKGDSRSKYMSDGISLNENFKQNIDDHVNIKATEGENENEKLKYWLYLKANPDQIFIVGSYLKGLNMRKIGVLLNMSDSRVCQILKGINLEKYKKRAFHKSGFSK